MRMPHSADSTDTANDSLSLVLEYTARDAPNVFSSVLFPGSLGTKHRTTCLGTCCKPWLNLRRESRLNHRLLGQLA